MNGSWDFQLAVFLIAAAVHLALLFGWQSKLMSILTWVLVVSLHRRNATILQGGDVLIRNLAFWAMFLPLGAKWSLDARRGPRSERHPQVCSLASACILFQMAMVYLFSAQLKTGRAWVVDSNAVYYALSVDQFTRPVGRLLLDYPEVMSALTAGTILLEAFVPFFAFVPFWTNTFRLLVSLSFVLFHAGLLWTMSLGPFPYICICGWILFFPPSFWDTFFGWMKKPVLESELEALPVIAGDTRASRIYSVIQKPVLLFFLANVLVWNIRTLDFERWEKTYSREYNFILDGVGLDQSWGMFAPYPLNWDGWYQIVGVTNAGRVVNLTPGSNPEDPITDERPREIVEMYPSERWRKYMMTLADRGYTAWRQLFSSGLANRWNDEHPRELMWTIDIYYFIEYTQTDGSTEPRKLLLSHFDVRK